MAEAAVIGKPDPIRGESIKAFVTLRMGHEPSEETARALKNHVRREMGPIAVLAEIEFTQTLPKTRSGKIMRRILRKIAEGDIENMGDTSTLADPTVVDSLPISARPIFSILSAALQCFPQADCIQK